MKTITVESLSDASNYAVIKLPERRFPALLIQGDSLKSLADLASELRRMVKDSPDDELRATADEIAESLNSRVEHYESVLAQEHMPLPYASFKRTM